MYEYRHRLSNRGRVPRRILVVAVVLLVLLLSAIFVIRSEYYDRLKPVNNSQQVVIVTIESGTTSTEIAETLQEKGLIRSSTMFQWYIRTNNVRDKLQAGTYALRPSMTVQEIVKILTSGSVKSKLLTILPGQRLDQVRQTFINSGFKPEEVDSAMDAARYSGHPALADKPASANLEGFLYPESYQVTDATSPAIVVEQALDLTARYLTPDIRSKFASRGLSVYQGVTLASMVEEEVSNQNERAQAAQVFLKRLSIGMPLGSDPTAFYGAILRGAEPSTTYDSPYNTLLYKGLPPGPISNVSKSSLEAIANPAATDWLYFVSGDDDVTRFSNTLDEHEALIRQYCKEKCAPLD